MYEKFYRLSGSPFRLTPDHRFFFQSAGHKKALSYLQYGLHQGEGFIVITGNVGTGKSTLVSQLFAELDTKQFVAAQINTTQIGADDVIRMIISAFDLTVATNDKATMLGALERFLVQQRALKKRVLLVVDEAQNLPNETLEELRMLSNLISDGHPLFQCFLVGQPQFDVKLRDPQLEQIRQRIMASYFLEPMSEVESQYYIEHRLHRVGWVGKPAITSDAYAGIYIETQGIPRRINTLCNRVLLYGAIEQLQIISGNVVAEVIADHHGEHLARPETEQSHPRRRSFVNDGGAPGTVMDEILDRRLAEIERILRQHDQAIRMLLNSTISTLASMKKAKNGEGSDRIEQDEADG